MQNKLELIRNKDDMLILGIESSCDETAASVICGKKILSNIISSQIAIHQTYGGVVPEIASRNHATNIISVVDEALKVAQVKLADIDIIAVTQGAGLQGALLVGIAYAKSLSYAMDIPLIAVNHIMAHLCANYLRDDTPTPPFIGLVASGGHSAILKMTDYINYEVIGSTRDDACGEAFDKVARVLSLDYPGGPHIDKLAKEGQPSIKLPRPLKNEDGYDMSYSGLKTAIINIANKYKQTNTPLPRADIACSFQQSAIDMIVDNAIRATKDYNLSEIIAAGGVVANSYLKSSLSEKCKKNNITLYFPDNIMCTDNAAMIASYAYHAVKYNNASPADLDLDAIPTISLINRDYCNK